MNPVQRDDAADAYEAGLRAGYAHGYDIGLEHGRRTEADLDQAADLLPPARITGPDRAELIARGYIPIDPHRPPALPVRLWDATDWAKADTRDLPTTDHGRTQWAEAIAAGRVPADLAAAFAERHVEPAPAADRAHEPTLAAGADRSHDRAPAVAADRAEPAPVGDRAAELSRDVDEAARVLAEVRARLEPAAPAAGRGCRTELAPWRGPDVLEPVTDERGVGR